MLKYKRLIFNPLQVNCWIVSDDQGNGLIFDPGCSDQRERDELDTFIQQEGLNVKGVVATHGHFDHIPGVNYVRSAYQVPFMGHADEASLIGYAVQQARPFGFEFGEAVPSFDQVLTPQTDLLIHQEALQVLHVPGHSAGSLAFYSASGGFVIVGDVLFKGSIGRTDLPGGDYDTLMTSIREVLMKLPAETKVLPGHGPETTIGIEQRSNPFLV